MFGRIKLNLPILATVVLIIFALHFVTGMVCRANPDPKVGDHFDAYLRPGLVVLLSPFLFLSKLFPHGWGQGNILGSFIYFGAMLLYSALLVLAGFGTYEGLRRIIKNANSRSH
jgi:hypothetical protein